MASEPSSRQVYTVVVSCVGGDSVELEVVSGDTSVRSLKQSIADRIKKHALQLTLWTAEGKALDDASLAAAFDNAPGESAKQIDLTMVVADGARVAHSEFDAESKSQNGRYVLWDVSEDELNWLAEQATRVRIVDADDPSRFATSRPDQYPIHDVRAGRTVGHMRSVARARVNEFWDVSHEDLLDKLWHDTLRQGGNLRDHIYHACNNGGGLHWFEPDPRSHHEVEREEGYGGWTISTSGTRNLELWLLP
mmetsp:Transcript_92936/g.262444  ORF Transcript_92936/g.262444 Transcript_92936/m.262444 type:complete len:250 (-) Transcript_92936:173-922(-)